MYSKQLQSMFLPASSKFVKLVFYECQITLNWENLRQIQSSIEQKEKTMKLGSEQTSLITFEGSLNHSPARFLNLGFPGTACAASGSVIGCTRWEGLALSI